MRTDPIIGDAKLTRFAELIEERLGLQYSGSSLSGLEATLTARMRALQCRSFDAYFKRLESDTSMHEELRELAAKLTIGETYFFRIPEQLRVFCEVAIPRLIQGDPARPIRILCAGCSPVKSPTRWR